MCRSQVAYSWWNIDLLDTVGWLNDLQFEYYLYGWASNEDRAIERFFDYKIFTKKICYLQVNEWTYPQ